MKKSCGIDGCKAGWFFFELSTEAYKCGVFTSFKELLFQLSQSENIFVDIPIGLPDAELN